MPPKRKDILITHDQSDHQIPKRRRTSLSDGRDMSSPEQADQSAARLDGLRRSHFFSPDPALDRFQALIEVATQSAYHLAEHRGESSQGSGKHQRITDLTRHRYETSYNAQPQEVQREETILLRESPPPDSASESSDSSWSPSQDRGKRKLKGEGPSATTPAQDQHEKKADEGMTPKLRGLLHFLQTLKSDKEAQPIRDVILAMEAPFKAGNQDQIQTSYEKILRSIQKLALQTKEQHIRDACQEVLAKVEPQQQRNLYAEGGSTDPEAILNLTKKFIKAASRPKLRKGQRYQPLGIRLTDPQYNMIREALTYSRISKAIRNKAKNLARGVSDGIRVSQAIYAKSDRGRARRSIINKTYYKKQKAASTARRDNLEER